MSRGIARRHSSDEPFTFLAVLAFVFAAALLASWLPAQRATRADPMAILRAS